MSEVRCFLPRRHIRLAAVPFLAMMLEACAPSITPVPLPDPGIPGFSFPVPEAEIVGWTEKDDQTAINKHGWGLWTAVTALTDQEYNGQKLRVFETWPSPSDITDGLTPTPHTLKPLNQRDRGEASTHGGENLIGDVRYDPIAAQHIIDNGLLSKAALNKLIEDGQSKIPDFPAAALTLKPIFQKVLQKQLVDGRYYKLAAWPGPPGAELPGDNIAFPPKDWKECVWVDLQNGGAGNGAVDKTCDPKGSSRTANNTYGIENFIHIDIAAPSSPSSLTLDEHAILVGMHITTREITRWTWQTFWWSPTPDTPKFPSSKAIAEDRPAQLQGPARNYVNSLAYNMVFPPQPVTGGKNEGNSVYAYNPWLEAEFGTKTLPDSEPGVFNGRKVPNNVGMQTNCMSCHARANYNPNKIKNAPDYAGDRYADIKGDEFAGVLTTDFLWSLHEHAK